MVQLFKIGGEEAHSIHGTAANLFVEKVSFFQKEILKYITNNVVGQVRVRTAWGHIRAYFFFFSFCDL